MINAIQLIVTAITKQDVLMITMEAGSLSIPRLLLLINADLVTTSIFTCTTQIHGKGTTLSSNEDSKLSAF